MSTDKTRAEGLREALDPWFSCGSKGCDCWHESAADLVHAICEELNLRREMTRAERVSASDALLDCGGVE